ncbi:MAG: aminotransferase class IV [Caulobacteraceae bacterium]
MIPEDDRGFTLGDGLFETILSRGGLLMHAEAHLARMAAGCAVLGLPAPDASDILEEAEAALAASRLSGARAAVRVTWTAGSGGRGLDRPAILEPRLIVTAAPAPPPAGPVRLATVGIRRNASSPVSELKSLAYLDQILARREAVAAGAEDALMWSTAGTVACATAANVFWLRDGQLETPALARGVLPGIMRGRVLELTKAREVECVDVRQAQAMFLTNSLIGVREVASLDGRAFTPHAMVRDLEAALAAEL